jgi:hypothetical protein
MSELLKIVNQDDPLQVVLRGHLVRESSLIKLIESALRHPKEVELQQISFSRRVDLGVAMGVLPKDMRARFLRINQIRNRFAHRLKSQIEDEDIQVLWDGLVEYDRKALQGTNYDTMDNLGKFGGFILITYHRLNQLHSFSRRKSAKRKDGA